MYAFWTASLCTALYRLRAKARRLSARLGVYEMLGTEPSHSCEYLETNDTSRPCKDANHAVHDPAVRRVQDPLAYCFSLEPVRIIPATDHDSRLAFLTQSWAVLSKVLRSLTNFRGSRSVGRLI